MARMMGLWDLRWSTDVVGSKDARFVSYMAWQFDAEDGSVMKCGQPDLIALCAKNLLLVLPGQQASSAEAAAYLDSSVRDATRDWLRNNRKT